jgi:hypothetical protein
MEIVSVSNPTMITIEGRSASFEVGDEATTQRLETVPKFNESGSIRLECTITLTKPVVRVGRSPRIETSSTRIAVTAEPGEAVKLPWYPSDGSHEAWVELVVTEAPAD